MALDNFEIVRLSIGRACIVDVTRERLEYRNEAGQLLHIDLETCVVNWAQHVQRTPGFVKIPPERIYPPARKWHCVGERDTSATPPWARFANERRTRFEFAIGRDFHGLLAFPLMKVGLYLFDWT